MRGLSFIVDGEFFTVDVTLVQKVARNMAVTPVPTAPEAVIGIANMKGRVVTVLSLTALLGRGREKPGGNNVICGTRIVHAVIFKSFTDGNDQMGLLITNPGDLVEISDDKILPLALKTNAEEKFCPSGMAEIEGKLYRIIDINSIINQFKNGGEILAETIPDIISNGGNGDAE